MSEERASRIRYRSMPGVIGGGVVIAAALVMLADAVIRGSGQGAWLAGFGLLTFIGVVYLISVYPAVIAKPDGIVVRNPLREIQIPWAAVHDMRIKYGLDITTKDGIVHAWAVPSSRSSAQRDLRRKMRSYDADLRSGTVPKDQQVPRHGLGFAERVLEELEILATQHGPAKPPAPQDAPRVVRAWSWPVLVPLLAGALGFVLVLVLG